MRKAYTVLGGKPGGKRPLGDLDVDRIRLKFM
jgi:hypothetical protein